MWIVCSIHDFERDAETRARGDVERLREFAASPCLRVLASLPLILVFMTGCSTQQKVVYEPLNETPIVGHYANGDVVTWSTRFPYDSNVGHPTSGAVILEPALFLLQVIILPAELVANPPFEEQEWFGAETPPTYTAQPPLPPPGGAPVQQIMPYPFLGPQAGTPTPGLPGSP